MHAVMLNNTSKCISCTTWRCFTWNITHQVRTIHQNVFLVPDSNAMEMFYLKHHTSSSYNIRNYKSAVTQIYFSWECINHIHGPSLWTQLYDYGGDIIDRYLHSSKYCWLRFWEDQIENRITLEINIRVQSRITKPEFSPKRADLH